MNIRDINNFFGDMDLFLMDAILKGYVDEEVQTILDVGCGDGRNGIYFMQQGGSYCGWDTDESKLQILSYLSRSFDNNRISFKHQDLRDAAKESFDLVICSRVLHFASSLADFRRMWKRLMALVKQNGLLYVSMDSTIDTDIAKIDGDGRSHFPDGKIRFALSGEVYREIKKGFEEVEPLKTLIHHKERAQSFMLLRKR